MTEDKEWLKSYKFMLLEKKKLENNRKLLLKDLKVINSSINTLTAELIEGKVTRKIKC